MKCPSCHSDNREGVKFCEECGTRFEVRCPKCGKRIPPGKKFCGECGHQIIKSEKPSPIEYDHPLSYTPKFLADKILTSRSSLGVIGDAVKILSCYPIWNWCILKPCQDKPD